MPAVLASTYPNKRVIVADNASTDDSILFLNEHFPSVEIIRNETNEGFAKGYNTALKKVTADYYVLLNSDVEVPENWIEPVISLMETDPLIAACQPKILTFDNRSFFEYAGACGGWIDKFGYPFSRGRVFDTRETDSGQYDSVQQCFWASGAAFFIRAKLYHEMGGLDEYFFAHQEEIDLCWRMQLAGYKIMSCPQSVVYHVGAGTLPRGGRKVYLNFRNNLVMLCKNLPWYEKLWKLPARIGLDAMSAWKGLLGGDTAFFIAITQAHLAVLKWSFRRPCQSAYPRKPLGSLCGVYHGSVVWQYFIKQHTRFQEIIQKKA